MHEEKALKNEFAAQDRRVLRIGRATDSLTQDLHECGAEEQLWMQLSAA
jgi:hypothetical protein